MKCWGFEDNVPEHWRSKEVPQGPPKVESRGRASRALSKCPEFLLWGSCGSRICGWARGAGSSTEAPPTPSVPGASHPGQKRMAGLLTASLPSIRAQPNASAWVQRPQCEA